MRERRESRSHTPFVPVRVIGNTQSEELVATTTNRVPVTTALDLLRDGVAAWVENEIRIHSRRVPIDLFRRYKADPRLADRPISDWDIAALLRLMTETWNEVFRDTLGHTGRSLVSELREWRNDWAHQKPFSGEDAYRVLDSVERLLTAVGAEREAGSIAAMKGDVLRRIAIGDTAPLSKPGVLPITLSPRKAREFKAALLQTRRATIRVTYGDGRVEEQAWDASRISADSNVIGNLRSRPAFRAGEWRRRGIAHVDVSVKDDTD